VGFNKSSYPAERVFLDEKPTAAFGSQIFAAHIEGKLEGGLRGMLFVGPAANRISQFVVSQREAIDEGNSSVHA